MLATSRETSPPETLCRRACVCAGTLQMMGLRPDGLRSQCYDDFKLSSAKRSPTIGHLHNANDIDPASWCGVNHSLPHATVEIEAVHVPPSWPFLQASNRSFSSHCIQIMHPSLSIQRAEPCCVSVRQFDSTDLAGSASAGRINGTTDGHGQNELLNELLLKLQQEDSLAVNGNGGTLGVCLLRTCSIMPQSPQPQARDIERTTLLKRKRELNEMRSCHGWGPNLDSIPFVAGDTSSCGRSECCPPMSEPLTTSPAVMDRLQSLDSAAGALLCREESRSVSFVCAPALRASTALTESAEQQLFAEWGGSCGTIEAPAFRSEPLFPRGAMDGKSCDLGLATDQHKGGLGSRARMAWMAQMSQHAAVTRLADGEHAAELTNTSSCSTGLAVAPCGRAPTGDSAAGAPGALGAALPVPPAESSEHKVRRGSTAGAL
jgi:hypothetical protein